MSYNGKSFKSTCITIGVPQGSVLGPVLFLVFINDFESVFDDAVIDRYAADTMLIMTSGALFYS